MFCNGNTVKANYKIEEGNQIILNIPNQKEPEIAEDKKFIVRR